MSAGDIAGRFAHAWPTTTRHLRVLEHVALITCEQEGRGRTYRLNVSKLKVIDEWLTWFDEQNDDEEGTRPMGKTVDVFSKVRELCLSMPDVDEAAHFGDASFRVGKKMFATCSRKTGDYRLQVQLEPEHAAALLERDPRFERYERMKHVVSLRLDAVKDWAEVRALLEESYALILGKKKPARKKS